MVNKYQSDNERLYGRLMAMAKIGATNEGGCNRQALTKLDIEGRELFKHWCTGLGMDVRLDSIGNLYACYSGHQRDGQTNKKILMGSHLDTQPTGGAFDGVYGVLAALEAVEVIHANNIVLPFDVEIVVWCNEEGCRFPYAMMGSAVWAGELDLNTAYELHDKDQITVLVALEQSNQRGDFCMPHCDVLAYFELHIEQGPILEQENLDIGVVAGVQQMSRWHVSCHGVETHAGPTPMSVRKDPVLAVSSLLQRLYDLEGQFDEHMRLTIGCLEALPGSPNTVPSEVKFTVDLRHPLPEIHEHIENAFLDQRETVEKGSPCRFNLEKVWQADATAFNSQLLGHIQSACNELGYTNEIITSGAGHDAVNLAKVVPSAMIFTPCKDGISHNAAEYLSPTQAKRGCDVLVNSIIEMAQHYA